MKKLILTLSFVIPTMGIYAQTDLKTAFEASVITFDKDPVAFVQKIDLSPFGGFDLCVFSF